eukprot:558753-Prorocentrum_lima.AAC.1
MPCAPSQTRKADGIPPWALESSWTAVDRGGAAGPLKVCLGSSKRSLLHVLPRILLPSDAVGIPSPLDQKRILDSDGS